MAATPSSARSVRARQALPARTAALVRVGRPCKSHVTPAANGTATLQAPAITKPTLLGMPHSNFTARVRHIIYKKGLDDQIDILPPSVLGGLKSPEYLALNPQGKMPLMVLPDGLALPESEVIAQYVLDKYAKVGPSLTASTPEGRARAALATRIHDVYIGPLQGCMYRKMDAAERASQLKQLVGHLDWLESCVAGPYVAGEEMTSADSALFPTFVFMVFMLPTYFGWDSVFTGRPKLAAWWEAIQQDPAAALVIEEVEGGLRGWAANNRWQDLGILDQVKDASYQWKF